MPPNLLYLPFYLHVIVLLFKPLISFSRNYLTTVFCGFGGLFPAYFSEASFHLLSFSYWLISFDCFLEIVNRSCSLLHSFPSFLLEFEHIIILTLPRMFDHSLFWAIYPSRTLRSPTFPSCPLLIVMLVITRARNRVLFSIAICIHLTKHGTWDTHLVKHGKWGHLDGADLKPTSIDISKVAFQVRSNIGTN